MSSPPERTDPVWTVHTAPLPDLPPARPRRERRVRPAAIGVAAALALVVGTCIVVLTSVAENRDMRRLLDRVEESESVMTRFQSDLVALGDARTPTAVEGVASRARSDLEAARERVSVSSVVPWASRIKVARDTYLGHADVWIETMGALADGSTPDTSEAIRITFDEACDRLLDAVPAFEGGDDAARIDAICTATPPPDGVPATLPV